MKQSEVSISVVIPVYRSSATLRELYARLCAVLDPLGKPYEIVLVDDASPDDSWEVLRALHAQAPTRLVALRLMRNYGQHNALMCGFRHARGEIVVTMDDDLQHPPEELSKLLDALETSGSDLVYGVPERKKHAAWRNNGAWLINLFYRTVFKVPVTLTSFRAIRRPLVEAILPYSLNYTFIDGLLAWNTQQISQVSVEHRPRAVGRSGYSLGKLLVLAFNLFTNFSLLPLQLVSVGGLMASVAGLLAGLFYLVCYLLAIVVVPGYASTIIAILVLGGLQLMALGIMGEYLGRLHLNVNRKPQYTVRTRLGRDAAGLPSLPSALEEDLERGDCKCAPSNLP